MTQKAMAELFNCSADNISLHLKNIFKDEELDKNSVTEEFSATALDGKKYKMKFYNLFYVLLLLLLSSDIKSLPYFFSNFLTFVFWILSKNSCLVNVASILLVPQIKYWGCSG